MHRTIERIECAPALDFAEKLTSIDRILPVFTVAPGRHAPYFDGQSILQPYDRGSAPGLLLALHRIRTHDPEALVIVLPPDFEPTQQMERAVRSAIDRALARDQCVVIREANQRWTGALVAPLERLVELFGDTAPWLLSIVENYFRADDPTLPRTLEELFRILPRRDLEDLLAATTLPIGSIAIQSIGRSAAQALRRGLPVT